MVRSAVPLLEPSFKGGDGVEGTVGEYWLSPGEDKHIIYNILPLKTSNKTNKQTK